MIWKPLQNRAPEIYHFLENLSLRYDELESLLLSYISSPSPLPLSCQWLRHNITSLQYNPYQMREVGVVQEWYQQFPVLNLNKLFIGGIFPISGHSFKAPELAPVALMAR